MLYSRRLRSEFFGFVMFSYGVEALLVAIQHSVGAVDRIFDKRRWRRDRWIARWDGWSTRRWDRWIARK